MKYVGWNVNSGFVEVAAEDEEEAEHKIELNDDAVFLGEKDELVENMEAFIRSAKQSIGDDFEEDLDEWIENTILDHDKKGTRVTDEVLLKKMKEELEERLFQGNGYHHICTGFAQVNALGAVEYDDRYIILAHVEHGIKDDESTNIVYGWDIIEMSKDLQGILSWDSR